MSLGGSNQNHVPSSLYQSCQPPSSEWKVDRRKSAFHAASEGSIPGTSDDDCDDDDDEDEDDEDETIGDSSSPCADDEVEEANELLRPIGSFPTGPPNPGLPYPNTPIPPHLLILLL